MDFLNDRKAKKKKRNSFKKVKIFFTSLIIFSNCFLWKSKSQIVYAQTIDNSGSSIDISENKFIGVEITKLDTWKKSSKFSSKDLQLFFKQSNKKSLMESKWGSSDKVSSNCSLNQVSTLFERISELKKCKENPRVNLEGLVFSGAKSYLLKNNFPKICSLEELIDETHTLIKTSGFTYDKFQNGESLQTLVNYFPNISFLTNSSKTIPMDSGKGFTLIKFLSNKGSPFYKRILSSDISNGFSVPINASKAVNTLIENGRKNIIKQTSSVKINKRADSCKLENHLEKYGIKICNIIEKKKKTLIDKKKFKLKVKFWAKGSDTNITRLSNKLITILGTSQLNKISGEKLPNYCFVSHDFSLRDFNKIDHILKKTHININSFNLVFRESLKHKDLPTKSTSSEFMATSARAFERFKKKKQISFFMAKDKIVRMTKRKQLGNLKQWISKKVNQPFSFHTFCIRSKGLYYPLNEKKQVSTDFSLDSVISSCMRGKMYNNIFSFIDKDRRGVQQAFPGFSNKKERSNKNSTTLRSKLNLGYLENYNFFLQSFEGNRNEKLYSIIELEKAKKNRNTMLNSEIFSFFKSFSTLKTKDWKTSISFLNRFKFYKNAKVLDFFSAHLKSGIEIPMSTIECQKICKKASDLGNSESQINRATSFISGAGVKKDKKMAFLIFSKMAHGGSAKGVYNIITMLKNGVGVEKDTLRALKILEISRNLITKERKPFKKHRKINKNGFFKSLFSSMRLPSEINLMRFFLEANSSPITSNLGAIIFGRSFLVASDINLTNISEKKGSISSKKKLKDLFIDNRQHYLFQETIKGLATTTSHELIVSILKWNFGLGFVLDHKLFFDHLNNRLWVNNIFYNLKALENILFISFQKFIYCLFIVWIWAVNFILISPMYFLELIKNYLLNKRLSFKPFLISPLI